MDFDIEKERSDIVLLLTDLAIVGKLSSFARFSDISYRTLAAIRYNQNSPKFETIQKIKASYTKFQEV